VTLPEKGTVDIYDTDIGGYAYTPNDNATGPDSFTFRVFDGTIFSNGSNPGTISVFINGSDSGNINPSSPTLIAPETDTSDIDFAAVEFSWQAAADPDGDDLSYKIAVCLDDPNASCTATTVNNQKAALHYSTLIALGSPSAGLLLFGLMGAQRRKQWRQTLILICIAISLGACSNAAEEAQNTGFIKGTPTV